jgi:glycine cleavage system H protein
MSNPSDLKFSETHEWVKTQGDTATLGITEYAQAQLGDVIYLEFPKVGQKVAAGGKFGVIESVKAASDLFSPVAGEITEVNQALQEHPEVINTDPYGKGWIIKLKISGSAPTTLMDQKQYDTFVQGKGAGH